jgi:hypothetical protein
VDGKLNIACGIPYRVIQSLYWHDTVKAINSYYRLQGYKKPGLKKPRVTLLPKRGALFNRKMFDMGGGEMKWMEN